MIAAHTPQELADLALVKLASHKPREAITVLEEAVAFHPDDPRIESDLAATWLVRAEADGEPLDLVRSLEASESALREDSHFAPALFNQAQALTRLGLREPARTSWLQLRQLDPSSGWTREADAILATAHGEDESERWRSARAELYRLFESGRGEAGASATIAQGFAQPGRELAEESLLGEWADSYGTDSNPRSTIALRMAHAIGDALAVQNRDLLLRESLQAIETSLAADPHGGRTARLVDGHRAFHRGLQLYKSGEVTAAASLFDRSLLDLEAAQSPFAYWAAFYRAICTYYIPDRPQARTQLQRLERSTAGSAYIVLEGRIQWMLGLIAFETGDWSKAISAYHIALDYFHACREAENEGAVENLLAVTFDYLDDKESAWRHRQRALALIPRVIDKRRLVNIFGAAANSLAKSYPLAGLPFARENAAVAVSSGIPLYATVALWQSALLEHATRHDETAATDLAQAREYAARMPDPALRAQEFADIELADGLVTSLRAPNRALASLERALDLNQGSGYVFNVPQILAERARIYAATGQGSLAMVELEKGIIQSEALLRRLTDPGLREGYLAHSLDMYNEMARLEIVEAHRPAIAFQYLERRRAQQLAVVPESSPSQKPAGAGTAWPLALADLQRSLASGAVLIEYLLADDALIGFEIRRGGIRAVVVEHSAERLNRLASTLLAAAQDRVDDARLRPLLAALSDHLLAPFRSAIADASLLIFVPDKQLFAVPFAALVDPRDGTYLLEHHSIAVALSGAQYAQARKRAEALPPGSGHALLVGDPAFNHEVFPNLQRLPAAHSELAELRRLYPRAEVLEASGATPRAFLDGVSGAELVHFSGHAATNSDHADRSMLVMADTPDGSPGALYARDLAGLSLPSTRLVVLAACGTGRGGAGGPGGISSLARPFLTAGVPSVIATLWDVDDQSAAYLSLALHRRIAQGSDSLFGLRQAQLEMLHSTSSALRSPLAWSAYELFGTEVRMDNAATRLQGR